MPKTTRPARGLNFAEAENVAAIAMEFGSSKRREAAYRNALDGIGFVGFYQIAVDAARALEKISFTEGVTQWGEEADWIQTVEKYADNILRAMAAGSYPSPHELEKIAKASIHWF